MEADVMFSVNPAGRAKTQEPSSSIIKLSTTVSVELQFTRSVQFDNFDPLHCHSWVRKVKLKVVFMFLVSFKWPNWGCTSGEDYVPCVYTHARWELP